MHGRPEDIATSADALRRVNALGKIRHLRWWLRLYGQHTAVLLEAGVADPILVAAKADPEGWRSDVSHAIGTASGSTREQLLSLIRVIGARETVDELGMIDGADVAETRRRMVQQHAPKLFIRSFGSLGVRTGSWHGSPVPIERKRIRALLALLVAHEGSTLSRDVVLETLWPDGDPASAVNNLNQAVFQLRRAIDPQYRDGDSPNYVISTVDVVQLNRDLVYTDLREFRRLARVRDSANHSEARAAARRIVDLVQGEFLPELRYEEWAGRVQTAVHAEIREVLLDVASQPEYPADLGVRAACVLVDLDELDEAAHIAMARQLASGGRTSAARDILTQFAARYESELDEPPPRAVQEAIRWLGVGDKSHVN
jgi:DNA-binding SARP family transcriptional activator